MGEYPGDKWHVRFLELAAHVAQWSKDPSTKVGAVIVRPDRTIVSLGYNGFPRRVVDHKGRLTDRSVKYPMTVHAETNAILSACLYIQDCSIYVDPLFPCASCAGHIIQVGITSVYAFAQPESGRWEEEAALATTMFGEAGVEITYL